MAFDAFISYARSSSTEEALALKSGLEAYARPWNKARSIHVFLDHASLTASPSLAGTLTESLAQSAWLIVLLTEAAAHSPWVDQEVAWWMQNKGTDRMLLVHVDGHVAWQRGVGFLETSTAVPASLRALREEPLWVDMTWFSQVGSLRRDDPRFAELVLQLFCPIRGFERGEAVALRDANVRRARRLARGAIASLSTLLVLALVSAGVAVSQMRAAQEQTQLATVRLLNAESQRLVDRDVGRARLLAAQANSTMQDDQSRRTLFGSLVAGPHLAGGDRRPRPEGIGHHARRHADRGEHSGRSPLGLGRCRAPDRALGRWLPGEQRSLADVRRRAGCGRSLLRRDGVRLRRQETDRPRWWGRPDRGVAIGAHDRLHRGHGPLRCGQRWRGVHLAPHPLGGRGGPEARASRRRHRHRDRHVERRRHGVFHESVG